MVTSADGRSNRCDLNEAGDAEAGFHRDEFGDGGTILLGGFDEHRALRSAEDGGFRNDESCVHRAQYQRDVGKHAGFQERWRIRDITFHKGGAGAFLDARRDEIDLSGGILAGLGSGGPEGEGAAGFQVWQVALRHLHLDLQAREVVHGGDDGLGGDEIADRERAGAGDAVEGCGDRGFREPDFQQIAGGLEPGVLGDGRVHFQFGNRLVF